MADLPARLTAALADRYALLRPLGAGGMATVYLADDLKHQRKVAIKVLKPELAAVLGAERFLAEIRTTANLQHPHILPLFDSGEADGFLYYVMPYIEGETLREMLDRERQLGVEQAVEITRAVASALDYAHRNDIVHRDIKPENILLHDGNPVVADFGIALAVSAAGGGRMTETGLSLGTPHYMSPEQASADRDASARSDVYSLGCVLYEMLAGAPPHTGPSAQAILVRILTEIPAPLTSVRHAVPAHVEAAVTRAIEKLPADRFATAEAFRSALADEGFMYTGPATILSGTGGTGGAPGAGGSWTWRAIMPWSVAAAAVLLGAAGWLGRADRTGIDVGSAPTIQSELWSSDMSAPDVLRVSRHGSVVTSRFREPLVERMPDGTIVTLQRPDGDDFVGSADYSPDGAWIGFSTQAGVYRVASGGGAAYRIADMENVAGVTWGDDERIYLSVDVDGVDSDDVVSHVLSLAPELGSVDTVATFVDARARPFATAPGGVLLAELRSPGAELPITIALNVATGDTAWVATDAAAVAWASTGHLVYRQRASGSLFAVPFDPEALEVRGSARVVLPAAGEQVAGFDITPDGTLVYASTPADRVGGEAMIWLRGDGTSEELPLPPVSHADPRLSPDGRRLAYVRGRELMVFDLDLGTNRAVGDGGFNLHNPVWSPEGDRVVARGMFGDNGTGVWIIDAQGGEPPKMIFEQNDGAPLSPVGWTSDGTILVVSRELPDRDVYALDEDPETPPRAVLVADWIEYNPTISPDLRWIAYTTTEDGTARLVVRSWPDLEDPVVVSAGDEPVFIRDEGGGLTIWSDDSRTIYYQQGDRVVAARVDGSGARLRVEARTTLPAPVSAQDGIWDLHADGERFLAVRIKPTRTPIYLVTNFQRRILEAFGAN